MFRGLMIVGPLGLVLAACDATGLVTSIDENQRGGATPGALIAEAAAAPGGAAAGSRAEGGTSPVAGGAFPTAEATGSGAERAFAATVLADLQRESFAANAEFCGYLGIDSSGAYVTSPVNQGTEASCLLPSVPGGMTVLASFHTHGTYSPYYASEFPTSTDMLTDAADGIDGYISTPGGRLWYVDTDTMTVRQLCGRGCLPQDPIYRPEDDGPVQAVFTLRDLQAYEAL